MKKTIIAISLLLSGCVFDNAPGIIVKDKLIIIAPPAEMTSIPPKVAPLNVTNATDQQAAAWLYDQANRTEQIENKLRALEAFINEKIEGLIKDKKPEDYKLIR